MGRPVCQLCGNFAEERNVLYGPDGGVRTATRVTCTTCGVYDVTMMLDSTLFHGYPQEDRYRLSGLTRRATERGETLELSSSNAKELLAQNPAPNPVEQVGLVLQYLDEHTSPGGPPAPLSMERDYTLAQANGADGLRFILNSMAKDGLIERTDKTARITMAGYERLEKHRKAIAASTVAPTTPGWDKVDRHISAAKERLDTANREEEFQQVGLLCREALISLAQAVFDPERHRILDRDTASPSDAGRMLEAVIAALLPGKSNEEARALTKAALRLANALQHDRAADKRTASLTYASTASLIQFLDILTRTPDG
jgi:hypothetical protein